MGNVKCTSFISLKRYWPSLGPDAEKKFLEILPPPQREVYLALNSDRWIPVDQAMVLNELAARFLYPDDLENTRLCKLGTLLGNLDLNGLTKLILKVASVQYAIQHSAELWHTYHDQGETFVEQPGKNHCRYLIFDYPGMPPKYQFFLAGWIQGLLEICRAKNPTVILQQAKPHIVYDIHWV